MTSNKKKTPKVLGIVLAVFGLALTVLGVLLAAQGGSFYYLIAGITLLTTAVWAIQGRAGAAYLFAVFLLVTLLWTLYEARLDAWSHLPRMAMWLALGLWMFMPRTLRLLGIAGAGRWAQVGIAAVALYGLLLFVGNRGQEVIPPTALNSIPAHMPDGDWAHYGASKRGTRYAAHDQINVDNVATLQRRWTYRTKVPGTFKGTPIQIGENLLLCTGQNIVVSLDPDTGTERWRYDPQITSPPVGFWDTCRGVTYYKAETTVQLPLQIAAQGAAKQCNERVFTATTDARLIALDVSTGQPCEDFGENGEISLLPGMGDVKPGFYFVTSPPTIASDTLVLGGWVADNQEVGEPSGVIRGFDPISGELRWAWDLGNEAHTGLPAEGETYTRGTPNVWSLTSADDELGLVYVPTGNATPDYYGGHRSQAMEKYASSIVALDARTGEARWHYQTTHHDIWDYDVPSQPTLADITIDGVVRKALIQPTKRAEVFVLDRITGEPLTQVEELPTPQTDLPDETTTATQPFSTGFPSFELAEPLTEADMWGITPFDHLACRMQFAKARYEGPLTPPSLQGTLYYPGVGGGMNWGSAAVDEVNQLLVVNVLHMPFMVTLYPQDELPEGLPLIVGGRQAGTPYAVRSAPFLSPLFAPCLRPPFGETAVVDLASQKVLWRRGIGTARDMGPLGIATGLPLPMGMFYQAGSIVTQGGLIFIGGVLDSTMRAIDVLTGNEIWTDDLTAPSQATPMSYVSPKTGKQYVIVTVPDGQSVPLMGAQAHGSEEADARAIEGGYVIAYRLPD